MTVQLFHESGEYPSTKTTPTKRAGLQEQFGSFGMSHLAVHDILSGSNTNIGAGYGLEILGDTGMLEATVGVLTGDKVSSFTLPALVGNSASLPALLLA